MGIVGMMMVHQTSKPYNNLRRVMIVALSVVFLIAYCFFPQFFTLVKLDFQSILILVVLGLLAWPLLTVLTQACNRIRERWILYAEARAQHKKAKQNKA